MKSRLFAALLAGTALTPIAAYAQAITVSHASANQDNTQDVTSPGSPAAVSVAVGDVIVVEGVLFNHAAGTPAAVSATDTAGNTFTSESEGTDSTLGHANTWALRAPVTVASSSDSVSVSFASAVDYPNVTVTVLHPPTGYSMGGMDFANSAPSVASDVVTMSGTASQGEDVLVSSVYGNGQVAASLGTGQTLLDDSANTTDSYSQPSASGSVSHADTFSSSPSPDAGSIIGEKVTATVAQCGSSVTPAISSGYYELQCQLNGNLTVNNPTGMGSSKDQMHFQFESDGAGHTVTFGSDYLLPGSTTGVLTEGTAGQLSNTSGDVDDVWGFGAPAFPTGSGERIHLGAPSANMGN